MISFLCNVIVSLFTVNTPERHQDWFEQNKNITGDSTGSCWTSVMGQEAHLFGGFLFRWSLQNTCKRSQKMCGISELFFFLWGRSLCDNRHLFAVSINNKTLWPDFKEIVRNVDNGTKNIWLFFELETLNLDHPKTKVQEQSRRGFDHWVTYYVR